MVNKTSQNARKNNPIPNNTPFTSESQPSPEAKKRGWAIRNARLRIQKHLESTLEEQLKNPALNKAEIEAMAEMFGKDATMADVIYRVYMRAIVDGKLSPAIKQKLADSLIKMGYGDRVEHTGIDGSPISIIIEKELIEDNE